MSTTSPRFVFVLLLLSMLLACNNDFEAEPSAAAAITPTAPKEGCTKGNCQNGKGVMYYNNALYQGTFKDGEMHGRGLLRYDDGDMYSGEFEDGYKMGRGHYKSVTGEWEYRGEWRYDYFEGEGTYVNARGDRYKGFFENGNFEGYGQMDYAKDSSAYDPNRLNAYRGEWSDDEPSGYGVASYDDSTFICGIWSSQTGDPDTEMPCEEVIEYLREAHDIDWNIEWDTEEADNN